MPRFVAMLILVVQFFSIWTTSASRVRINRSSPASVSSISFDRCGDTGAIGGDFATGQKGAAGWYDMAKGAVTGVSTGCYCDNREKARPSPHPWGPAHPEDCNKPFGTGKCYCPSLFRKHFSKEAEAEEATEVFQKLSDVDDASSSPCQTDCGATTLEAGHRVVENHTSRGLEYAEIDQASVRSTVSIRHRTGRDYTGRSVIASALPSGQCAGACHIPLGNQSCHSMSMERIGYVDGDDKSVKCCAKLYTCEGNKRAKIEPAILLDTLAQQLMKAGDIYDFGDPEEQNTWNANFQKFSASLLTDAMNKFRAGLSEQIPQGRSTESIREDEFTSIFWGSGVPAAVKKLSRIDYFDDSQPGGLGFTSMPKGSEKMEALAKLVATLVGGIAQNAETAWDAEIVRDEMARDEHDLQLIPEAKIMWDEQDQKLTVTLPVPMQGRIASTSRVPVVLHVPKTMEFTFKEDDSSAEVEVNGLWAGPHQGVYRFLTDAGFKKKLTALVGEGVADLMPHEAKADESIAELARIASNIYLNKLAGKVWQRDDDANPERFIAEWFAGASDLLNGRMVKPFVDAQDFPDIMKSVATVLPLEIRKFMVVEHTSGALQLRASRRVISSPIAEWTDPANAGVPVVSDAERAALSAMADRAGYQVMAEQRSTPPFGSMKTKRELALGMGQATSAISWLSMFACDPDPETGFPGFKNFPANLGSNKNTRYPNDEPLGGSVELITKLFKLCNDAVCKGDKGRTKWVAEPADFMYADAPPGHSESSPAQ